MDKLIDFLRVKLWGKEIGRLSWDTNRRLSFFYFNHREFESMPDISPILLPKDTIMSRLPICADERQSYHGLPPFISDSLPDAWGNTVFEKWALQHRIPFSQITPLYKLLFIGERGMGALEYEPAAPGLRYDGVINIKELYKLSQQIMTERDAVSTKLDDNLTIQSLYAVGASAGGRQPKVLIAINPDSGEIRSGQCDSLKDFDYYLLKFASPVVPLTEIEQTYYQMAVDAGIDMMESRLFEAEGIKHFLTKRYDRKNGEKIHVQTLHAMNPEANSYEHLVDTCRRLHLSEIEVSQVFRRMVFNVMSNNTDDHNKNFSFLLEKDGEWHISPAYDVTFIFQENLQPNKIHRLSIGGKTTSISKEDLLDFAKRNDIRNAKEIIDQIESVIGEFGRYAKTNGVGPAFKSIIQSAIQDRLVQYGYAIPAKECRDKFVDDFKRIIENVHLEVNTKNIYVLSAFIDGHRRRKFIKTSTPGREYVEGLEITNLSDEEKAELVRRFFPI